MIEKKSSGSNYWHSCFKNFAFKFPLRILVVEDVVLNQKLATIVLGQFGYFPIIASNGIVAINICSSHDFDLILMDILMPEMDGLETTRYLSKTLINQPYIIDLTATSMPEARQQCINSGMNDYLTKPLKFENLIAAVKNMISNNGKF